MLSAGLNWSLWRVIWSKEVATQKVRSAFVSQCILIYPFKKQNHPSLSIYKFFSPTISLRGLLSTRLSIIPMFIYFVNRIVEEIVFFSSSSITKYDIYWILKTKYSFVFGPVLCCILLCFFHYKFTSEFFWQQIWK